MNKNTILITIVSLIGIFGFLFAVYTLTNKPSDDTVYNEAKQIESDDHTKWSTAKKHILVDYSDLQCPACKAYHEYLEKEFEASGAASMDIAKNITFVYRHFPLTTIHAYALEAAYAAEAAGEQGKFFPMVDLLFEKQDDWAKADNAKDEFVKLAKQLKLDEKKFKEDMDSSKIQDRVQKDMTSGGTVGVRGTPTFYLDGKKVEVASFEDFTQLLAETAKK